MTKEIKVEGYPISYRWIDGPKARVALMKIADLLDGYDVKFWLDYGTLLGAVRDKSFIVHDYDVDLGVMIDDASRLHAHQAEMIQRCNEFIVGGYSFGKECFLGEITFSCINVKVDVYVWYKSKDGSKYHRIMWHEGNRPDGYKISEVPSKYFDNLSQIEFLGRKYQIPGEAGEFLTLRYGQDWESTRHQCLSGDTLKAIRWVTAQEIREFYENPLERV